MKKGLFAFAALLLAALTLCSCGGKRYRLAEYQTGMLRCLYRVKTLHYVSGRKILTCYDMLENGDCTSDGQYFDDDASRRLNRYVPPEIGGSPYNSVDTPGYFRRGYNEITHEWHNEVKTYPSFESESTPLSDEIVHGIYDSVCTDLGLTAFQEISVIIFSEEETGYDETLYFAQVAYMPDRMLCSYDTETKKLTLIHSFYNENIIDIVPLRDNIEAVKK